MINNCMEIEFINTLCESRMFRTKNVADTLDVDDAADLAFMSLMIIAVFNKSYDFAPLASEYADRTIAYSNFDRFRMSGTDLYISLNRLLGKDQDYLTDNDQIAIKRVNIDSNRIKRFLKAIAKNDSSSTIYRELYRFEKDLNIQDSMLKSIRRLVSDWDGLSHSQRSVVVTRMKQFMMLRAKRADLTAPLLKFHKMGNYEVNDEGDTKKKVWDKPIVKAAVAIGGTIAAYKAGSAIGKKLGKTSYSTKRNLGNRYPTRSKKD